MAGSPSNSQQKRIKNRLWHLYNQALNHQGEVSLGKGAALLDALVEHGNRQMRAQQDEVAAGEVLSNGSADEDSADEGSADEESADDDISEDEDGSGVADGEDVASSADDVAEAESPEPDVPETDVPDDEMSDDDISEDNPFAADMPTTRYCKAQDDSGLDDAPGPLLL